MRRFLLVSALFLHGLARADEADEAKKRWESSPHGPMLERILPPTYAAADLPDAASQGARLTLRYCVQCHNLANPAMHHAAKWPGEDETRAIVAYLQKYAQTPLDVRAYPEVNQPSGEAFRLACSQCHVLPDPKRHTAYEWPTVVARMQENMEWMNRVVGSQPVPGEPQLRIEEINAFLRRYARR